jgi:hypothetical protein
MDILMTLKDEREIQHVYRYCDVNDAKQSDRQALDAVNVDGLAGAAALMRPKSAEVRRRIGDGRARVQLVPAVAPERM